MIYDCASSCVVVQLFFATHLCFGFGSVVLSALFLSQAVATLMLQQGSTAFKATPLLKALRAAAVMALPPKAATATSATATAATTDAAATESSEGRVAGMDAETHPVEEEEEEVLPEGGVLKRRSCHKLKLSTFAFPSDIQSPLVPFLCCVRVG